MSDQPQSQTSPKHPVSGRKAAFWVIVLLLVAVAVAVAGIIPRERDKKKLADTTVASSVPDVQVAPPVMGMPNQEVVLPGNIFAYEDSPIYARTSGYLTKWYFDIGARVRKGQMLGIIASPEVDQQLLQARADLATAQANAGNAQIQAQRYRDLLKQNAVSAQDRDNFVTQQVSTNTQVKAAQANVQRLEQLVGFEKISAPFSGILTARDVDTGTLIDAGANRELFHMADEHILRVYVNVPQVYSLGAIPGVQATLGFREFPGRNFTGKIVRTSKAIDPASRTLLVEVDVDNRSGQLYPGMYTEVHFKLNVDHPTLIVPVSTLIFRTEGLRIAIVQNGKAKLVPIVIGQDDGRVVQVISGITAQDQVVQNPPDSITDGEDVHAVEVRPAEPRGEPEGSSATGSEARNQQQSKPNQSGDK